MRLLLSPMVISMTDKKHLSSASQEKLSSYSSSASKNATSSSNTSAKNNLKRTISTASPQGAEDEDKRPQPKRRKSTGAEVPHGSGSSSRKVAAPRPMPLSERQQLALLMQMTAAESQQSDGDRMPALPSSAHKRSTAKVEKRNERGETALHIASKRGDAAEVKKLINAGANVNVTDYAGWTALHEACNRGHQTIARLLLKAGANVNVQGMDNDTPLHDAATSGHCKLVQLLLRHGANPSQSNKQGKSPLDLASSAEVLRLLRSELITSASSCSSESLLEPRSPTSPESGADDDRRLTSPAKGSMSVTPAKIESRTPSSGGVPQLSPQSMWTPSSNLKVDDGVPPSQSTQLSPRLSVDSSSSQHYQSHGHGDQSSPRLTLKICRKESTSSESNVTSKQNSYSVTLASSKDKERLDSGSSPVGSVSSDDSGDTVKFKSSNSSISFVGSKSQQQQQHREDVTRDSTEANALSSADKTLNSPRLPQSSSGNKGASITKGTSGKSASTRDSGRTESDSVARPASSSLSSSLSSMPVIGGSSSTSVISSVRSSESVSRTLAATQYTYGASSLSRTHHAPTVSTPSWLNGSSGSSGSSGSGIKARVPLTSAGTSQSISSSLSATANHSARSSVQGHVNMKNKDVPAVGTSSLHSMQRAEKSPYSVGGMTTHAKPPQQPPATGASITFRNGSAPIPAYPPHHNSTTSASFQNKVANGRSSTTTQHSSTPVTHTPKQQSPLLASFEDISDSEDDQQQSVGKSSKSASKPLSFAMSSGPASSISTPPSSNIVRHTTIPSLSPYGNNNSSLSSASLPSSAASQNSAAMLSGSTNGLKPLPDMNASKAGLNGVRMSSAVDSHKASLAWSTISSDKPMYQHSGNWTSTNGGHSSRGVPSDGKSSSVVPSLPSSANSSMMKLAGMSQDLPRAGIPTLPGNSGQVTSVIVGNSSSREKAVNKPTTPLSALDNRSSLNSMPTLPYSSQKVPSGIIPSSITTTSSVALPKTNGGPPALYVGREVDKTMPSVTADSKHTEINSSNKIRLNRGIPEPTSTHASLLQSQSTEDVAAKRRKFESTSEMKPQVPNAKADVQQQEASVRSSMPSLQALSNGSTSAGNQQTSLPSKSVAKVEFPSVTVDTPTSKTLVDVSKQLLVAQVGQGPSPTTFDSKDKDSVVVRDNRVTTLAASISPAAASLPAIQEKVDGRLPCINSLSESSLQSLGKVSTTATIASSLDDTSFHSKIGPAKTQDPVSTSPVDRIAVSIPHKATAGEKSATTDFSPSNLAMKDSKEKATEEASKTLQPSSTADEETTRDVKKEASGEVTKEAGSEHEDDNEEEQSSRPATPKVPPIRIILSGTHNADKESKDVPGKHALPYVVNTTDLASLPGSVSPTGKILPPGESDEQLGDDKSRTRGEGDKMTDFEDEAVIGKEAVGERRVTRSALRAQREKKQLGGKPGSTDIKTGEEQSSEKDAATVHEVSEELPVHPRKRKLTRARINHEPVDVVVPIELPADPHNLYIIDKQDNPYRSVRDLKKKMMQRHSQLLETPVSLKAPDDFKSYLMSSRNYLLSGKSVPLMPRSTPSTPPTVPLSLQTLYSKQEYQRQQLERQHVVEKEKVVLAMEMQLLREHARGYVETSAGGPRSLSFCSLMRDQGNLCCNGRLVEETTRASTRSHSSSRDLLRWKKEVLDKFEKIKADVCGRQRFEAEALQASQRLEWEWMLVQNHLCDSRTVPQVDALCVPMASVDDEFIVNRQVSRRTV